MNRFDLLSDIRDLIRSCLGPGCAYELVITRGRPPQECDQIALWAGRDTTISDDDCGFCEERFTMLVYVQLTRVCVAGRANLNMDYSEEEEQALCFYRDLDLLECCIDDADQHQILADHQIDSFTRVSTEPDDRVNGDAYSALLTLRVSGEKCCVS